MALDNLSTVADWLSDALCRAATGEGMVKRALYTDDGLSVVSFRRAIILTSIDAGALRGDLGERLVPVELERISTEHRRTDAELAATFAALHPSILGALFTLTASILAALDHVQVADLPRMADFGRILAALDHVTGWRSLDLYREAASQVAADVVQGDPLALAVTELVGSLSYWHGTPTELLRALDPYRHDSGAWPKSAKTLSGRLMRLAPALRSQGIAFEHARGSKQRTITLSDAGQDTTDRDARDARDALPSVESMRNQREV